MNTSSKFAARKRVLFTPLADGTGVLLDLETKFYFTLNRTGVVVWRSLEAGPEDANTLSDTLCDEFDVDADTALDDVQNLLSDLVENSLLVEIPA